MIVQRKVIIAVLMAVVLFIGVFAGNLMKGEERVLAETNEESNRKTVTAQGEGVVLAAPDIALVTLGVETTHKEMNEAQSDNRRIMNEIMGELEKLGINSKDIQTNNYSVYPDYQWQKEKNVLIGYKVINTVNVKIRKIEETGRVIDAAAAKGANLINGIQFTVEDSGRLYEEALKIAVKNAEDKAKVMTGYFGIRNLAPVTITEKPQGYYPIYENARMLADSAPSTPVSIGQMEIRASVDVTFEY